jgi:hypothetical protein
VSSTTDCCFTATLADNTGRATVKNVLSLRRSDLPLPPLPTGPQLATTAGDRIAGSLVGGDAQTLRFRPSGLLTKSDEAWKVPLSAATVLWLAATPADTPVDPARYNWLGDVRNRDVLRFRNGDIARGTLDGLDPDAARPTFGFCPEQGAARSVRDSELAAVAFNPALARSRKPKGGRGRAGPRKRRPNPIGIKLRSSPGVSLCAGSQNRRESRGLLLDLNRRNSLFFATRTLNLMPMGVSAPGRTRPLAC